MIDDTVKVQLGVNRELFFARVLGFTDANVTAQATATVGGISRLNNNLVPIGFTEEEYLAARAGQEGQLFVDFHITGAGNWGIVNFDSKGEGQNPNVIANYIRHGYPHPVQLYQEINVVTGAASGGSQPAVKAAMIERIENEDIVFVPIIRVPGGGLKGVSKQVLVIGFAAVVLTEFSGQGANVTLRGSYVRTLSAAGPVSDDAPSWGLQGVTLVP